MELSTQNILRTDHRTGVQSKAGFLWSDKRYISSIVISHFILEWLMTSCQLWSAQRTALRWRHALWWGPFRSPQTWDSKKCLQCPSVTDFFCCTFSSLFLCSLEGLFWYPNHQVCLETWNLEQAASLSLAWVQPLTAPLSLSLARADDVASHWHVTVRPSQFQSRGEAVGKLWGLATVITNLCSTGNWQTLGKRVAYVLLGSVGQFNPT